MPMPTNKVQMTSTGISSPIGIFEKDIHPRGLPPGILVNLSAGGAATFDVVVTGDDISPTANYVPAQAIWNILDGAGSLTASANFTLIAKVTGIALRVNSYTSGTVTLQVVQ